MHEELKAYYEEYWPSDEHVEILDATRKAMDEYGHHHGSSLIVLTQDHIDALLSGKMLAWDDSEYTSFVVFDSDVFEKNG